MDETLPCRSEATLKQRRLESSKPAFRPSTEAGQVLVDAGNRALKKYTQLPELGSRRNLVSQRKAAGCRAHFKQFGTALAIQLGISPTGAKEHRAKGGHPDHDRRS